MSDSASVAGQVWDRYLSRAMRDAFGPPEIGRALFTWLSALHDLGKASPTHQKRSQLHYGRVNAVAPHTAKCEKHIRHERLSSYIVRRILRDEEGWPDSTAHWVADLLAAHHGIFYGTVSTPEKDYLGGAAYEQTQRYLFDTVSELCRIDLPALRDHIPGLGPQLAFSGAVVMSDWLASNSDYFPYTNGFVEPGKYAQISARIATDKFQEVTELHRTWVPEAGTDHRDLFSRRFGIDKPHSAQQVADEVARTAEAPGLMVIEAPTGNGKTEAALAAAEVLADRFRFNGLLFVLPTQATTNGIFDRLLKKWQESQPYKPTVSLVHGKARLKKGFADLPSGGVADGGCDSLTVSSWMRGAKKALLSPVSVSTIDQLLFAGVAARYVQLRHLGLANKVVVIDEVHAYDTYMSQILQRVLHWLGLHGVSVILLSATLPPAQRSELLGAYSGAANLTVPVPDRSYPLITWSGSLTLEQRLDHKEGTPVELPVASYPAGTDEPAGAERRSDVRIEFVPEEEHETVSGLLRRYIRDSPRANVLVLRNTVRRAQEAYDELSRNDEFEGFELTLAHSRFTAADRERIDRTLSKKYGPPNKEKEHEESEGKRERPEQSVVVATQVAEQSLDLDFDLVVSDLAPIDLLLQRAGRCHRHQERPEHERGALTTATLVITGYRSSGDGPPTVMHKNRYPYDYHLLYRTLAVLTHPEPHGVLKVPGQVPDLISQVYDGGQEVGPRSWQPVMAEARAEFDRRWYDLERHAAAVLLPEGASEENNQRLGSLGSGGNELDVDEAEEQAAHVLPVRHGADSTEVVLLRRTSSAQAVTVSDTGGSPVTVPLDRVPGKDLLAAIGDQAIRLPDRQLEGKDLTCPKEWRWAPWLKSLRVLLLEPDCSVRLGSKSYRYSSTTGWHEA